MIPSELRSIQRMLLRHGGLVMLFGFAAGFGFVFFLIGSIELWPIPGKISIQLPGSEKAWRMTHMEGVLNGLLLWLLAAVLPAMDLSLRQARRIALALVLTAWTFPIAALFDALFADSRGLKFGGPITNMIPFFLFYIGILALVWAVVSIVIAHWRAQPDEGR
jgi:hypothetical protein